MVVREFEASSSSSPSVTFSQSLARTRYFLNTLYLFTASDFTTFAIPTTIFGLCSALSGPLLTTNSSPSLISILSRIPLGLVLVWINLLVFNISNQRTPSAVDEDRINKPSRPIPCGRITCDEAKELLLWLVPMVGVLGYMTGLWEETLLLFAAQWMYNDLGGCDAHYVVRNFLIAVGYGLYSSIALRSMLEPGYDLTPKGMHWLGLITFVMFTTQHICDIKDVEGDRLRGRRSAPVVLGEANCRWSVALPVLVCSAGCVKSIGLGWKSYAMTMGVGGIVAVRTIAYRNVKADRLTWKIWAAWTCVLFVLPLVENFEAVGRAWNNVVGIMCFPLGCEDSLNIAAVSAMALAIEGRRIIVRGFGEGNGTISVVQVDGVLT